MNERETPRTDEPDDLASAIGGFINKQKARIAQLERELAETREECLEQARLIGMSGEREADLRARLEEAQKQRDRLKNALEDIAFGSVIKRGAGECGHQLWTAAQLSEHAAKAIDSLA